MATTLVDTEHLHRLFTELSIQAIQVAWAVELWRVGHTPALGTKQLVVVLLAPCYLLTILSLRMQGRSGTSGNSY